MCQLRILSKGTTLNYQVNELILLLTRKRIGPFLKTFLNNKKIPCIPPLFHENKFITNFKEKAELFNTFFANHCTLQCLAQ